MLYLLSDSMGSSNFFFSAPSFHLDRGAGNGQRANVVGKHRGQLITHAYRANHGTLFAYRNCKQCKQPCNRTSFRWAFLVFRRESRLLHVCRLESRLSSTDKVGGSTEGETGPPASRIITAGARQLVSTVRTQFRSHRDIEMIVLLRFRGLLAQPTG